MRFQFCPSFFHICLKWRIYMVIFLNDTSTSMFANWPEPSNILRVLGMKKIRRDFYSEVKIMSWLIYWTDWSISLLKAWGCEMVHCWCNLDKMFLHNSCVGFYTVLVCMSAKMLTACWLQDDIHLWCQHRGMWNVHPLLQYGLTWPGVPIAQKWSYWT